MTRPDDYTAQQWEEAHWVWAAGKHYDALAQTGQLPDSKYAPLIDLLIKVYHNLQQSEFIPDAEVLSFIDPVLHNETEFNVLEELIQNTIVAMKENS